LTGEPIIFQMLTYNLLFSWRFSKASVFVVTIIISFFKFISKPRPVFLNLFLYAEPFLQTKISVEPICCLQPLYRTPLLPQKFWEYLTGIECFKASHHKILRRISAMIKIYSENICKGSNSRYIYIHFICPGLDGLDH
jgi:hypothetical protein